MTTIEIDALSARPSDSFMACFSGYPKASSLKARSGRVLIRLVPDFFLDNRSYVFLISRGVLEAELRARVECSRWLARR